jgi:hypothetical protein
MIRWLVTQPDPLPSFSSRKIVSPGKASNFTGSLLWESAISTFASKIDSKRFGLQLVIQHIALGYNNFVFGLPSIGFSMTKFK